MRRGGLEWEGEGGEGAANVEEAAAEALKKKPLGLFLAAAAALSAAKNIRRSDANGTYCCPRTQEVKGQLPYLLCAGC